MRSKQGELNRLKSLPRNVKHWRWQKNPTVVAIHKRLYNSKGKASKYKCIDCKKKARDWSNNTGNYKNIKDFSPRCRRCHILKDGLNLHNSKMMKRLWKKRKL